MNCCGDNTFTYANVCLSVFNFPYDGHSNVKGISYVASELSLNPWSDDTAVQVLCSDMDTGEP